MDAKKVGSTIRTLRTRVGFTQHELAKRLSVTDKAVSKWERGLGIPDISIITDLANLLNIDVDNLLEGNIAYLESSWVGILLIDTFDLDVEIDTVLYDKPLIYIWLSYFMLAGIKKIHIRCSEHHRRIIERMIGQGEKIGLKLSFHSDEFELSSNNLMIVEDSIFVYGSGLTKCFQRAMLKTGSVIELAAPRRYGDNDNRVTFKSKNMISDANVRSQSYFKLPILFVPFPIFGKVTFANGKKVQKKENSQIEPLGKGMVECPLKSSEDLNEVGSFIRFMQRTTGYQIYCIEEVAWRRGFITTEQVYQLVNSDIKLQRYILNLCQEMEEMKHLEK